jgi:Cu(I)/Ag(I) efflux system membrane fusion protein
MKAKSILTYLIFLSGGIFLGWLLFGGSGNRENSVHNHAENEPQTWTCAMHPQVKQDKPGKCPLCAMDLVPLKTAGTTGGTVDDRGIALSKEAMALADIHTTKAAKGNPVKEIHLYGSIQINEQLSHSQTSHVSGRIEKLFVNFAGETVRQGQVIASVYSPELLNAQQELLEAVKLQGNQPALLDAAREKLRLWKLTDSQITSIEQSGKASALIDIAANAEGIVVAKKVEQGAYVAQGTALFELVNLSSVWAVFDAYEADLPYLKVGDGVNYTVQAIPGQSFSGKITFISPVLDKTTRTAKIRAETLNAGLRLKPEMYASATVNASLKQYSDKILIPATAVLWTGKRSIVYVKRSGSATATFELREVELGPSLGDSYVIMSGIAEGEEIVTGGVFSIDASMQLEGKRSMMNDEHRDPDGSHAEITVQGLCTMCKERIENAATAIAGVSAASWDMTTKRLHLRYDTAKTSVTNISEAIAVAGHDTDSHHADKQTYDALPDCCKYRK